MVILVSLLLNYFDGDQNEAQNVKGEVKMNEVADPVVNYDVIELFTILLKEPNKDSTKQTKNSKVKAERSVSGNMDFMME